MADSIKISDSKRDDILAKLELDINAANDYYTKTIEPLVKERYEIYRADKEYYRRMYPKLSKRCEITSTDVQDVIESTMPNLMKTFFGSTEIVTVKGMDGTSSDEQRAEKMQALINFELERQQFFMIFYQWAKDALITNLGIIKVDWERIIEPVEQQQIMTPQAAEQFMQIAQQQGFEVQSVEQDPANGAVIINFTAPVMKKNQPRVMNVLASEFRFSPDATSLEEADFVAHRKIVTIDYLRKQAESGLYSNVEELVEKANAPEYTALDIDNNEDIDEVVNDTDSGRRKVELYECYTNINMTDDPDGELTPMIITVSNGVILRMEENTYERHPFFTLSPRIDPHKIWPDNGFVDLIAQVQHAKTAILRQMIYNMAQGNDSKLAINIPMLEDVNDVLENAQFVRVKGNVNEALMPIPAAPLQSWTFNMLEYLDTVKENRTGITKYNQGMASDSLNKTATGINILTQQSNQRMELIARIFAETGLRDMFKFLIKVNQLFVNQEMVIRLTNEPMQIAPDDLEGDFDLVINSGMGSGAKEQNLQDMQMLQALMTQLAQAGFVGPEQIYNAAKKYIETIGFKNVDDFLMNPEQAMQYQQQMAMSAGTQNQPMSENLRLSFEQLPWQVQMQVIQKEGYQVDPNWWTEKATEDVLKTAAEEGAKGTMKEDNGYAGNAGAVGRMAQTGGQGAQGGGNSRTPQRVSG